MRYKILGFSSLASILILLLVFIYIYYPTDRSLIESHLHYAAYSQKHFYTHLTTAETIKVVSEKVYGAIVSHHFYAEKEIATLFLKLRGQDPDVVVILGPNHFNTGMHNILVSAYPYSTPWGILEPDMQIVQSLAKNKVAYVEEDPFVREHSISNLVGFIKYVFPQTKIVPIIIKSQTKSVEVDKLIKTIDENLDNDSLVVASVDFSHHTTVFNAGLNDATSIEQIKNFNCDGLTNNMMDSPLSICILLKYLDSRGARAMTYWQSSSAQISGNYQSQDVTSYLFSYFTK